VPACRDLVNFSKNKEFTFGIGLQSNLPWRLNCVVDRNPEVSV
jgi:hypothetical protein